MTRLEITLLAILLISTCINIGLFVYARAVVVRLLAIAEELWDLQTMIDAFAKHTSAVYQMETFYGDQALKGLLQHAVSLNEQLETFEHVYNLTEKDEIENTEADGAPENEETS